MPRLLRKIKFNRWLFDQEVSEDWEQFPADPVGDLKTQGNGLSFWRIEDDGSNLDRVIAAMVSRLNDAEAFEYVTVAFDLPADVGLKNNLEQGDTHDALANEQWHYDVVEITGAKLVRLAHQIALQMKLARKDKDEVVELLRDAVSKGWIQRNALSSKLAAKIA